MHLFALFPFKSFSLYKFLVRLYEATNKKKYYLSSELFVRIWLMVHLRSITPTVVWSASWHYDVIDSSNLWYDCIVPSLRSVPSGKESLTKHIIWVCSSSLMILSRSALWPRRLMSSASNCSRSDSWADMSVYDTRIVILLISHTILK